MLMISKIISPFGVFVTTLSPTFLPNKFFPRGESMDNFFSFKEASTAETKIYSKTARVYTIRLTEEKFYELKFSDGVTG